MVCDTKRIQVIVMKEIRASLNTHSLLEPRGGHVGALRQVNPNTLEICAQGALQINQSDFAKLAMYIYQAV